MAPPGASDSGSLVMRDRGADSSLMSDAEHTQAFFGATWRVDLRPGDRVLVQFAGQRPASWTVEEGWVYDNCFADNYAIMCRDDSNPDRSLWLFKRDIVALLGKAEV
jgi:hypothetical protein